MDKEVYEEIKEKLEKIKRGIPYLEKAVKSKKKEEIKNSVSIIAYDLHRLYKEALGKGTSEAINDMAKWLWKFRNKKHEEKRKYVPVEKQYKKWAKEYDEYANILIFLEEKKVKSFLGKVKGKDILDYGCGTGRNAIPLAKKGANVTCIDFTQAMLNEAKKKAKKAKVKIDVKRKDITKYKPDKKFDIIISALVLDHIRNLKKVVNIINKASKIDTEVIITNVHPELLRKDVNPKTGKAQGYLVEGFKTDQYYHPISEYIELFKEKGFYLVQTEHTVFDKKCQKMKKFKECLGMKDKLVGIIMKFKKLK